MASKKKHAERSHYSYRDPKNFNKFYANAYVKAEAKKKRSIMEKIKDLLSKKKENK